ncbi:MAG: hypothetical protein Q8O89_00160 [Nanoarchaeota archaeon]|nr:hypothetical protein [Nanoarchaeota archaeon]
MKETWEGRCAACQHVITNPICPECKAEEAMALQRDKNVNMDCIKRLAKSFNKYSDETVRCIICNKPMNICTYCFLELFDLEEEDKNLIREFQQIE